MESAEDVRNLDWTAEWPKILDDSPVASEINAVTWVAVFMVEMSQLLYGLSMFYGCLSIA